MFPSSVLTLGLRKKGERSVYSPMASLEQLGLEFVKLGVPSVKSVCVGVDSERLRGGDVPLRPPGEDMPLREVDERPSSLG